MNHFSLGIIAASIRKIGAVIPPVGEGSGTLVISMPFNSTPSVVFDTCGHVFTQQGSGNPIEAVANAAASGGYEGSFDSTIVAKTPIASNLLLSNHPFSIEVVITPIFGTYMICGAVDQASGAGWYADASGGLPRFYADGDFLVSSVAISSNTRTSLKYLYDGTTMSILINGAVVASAAKAYNISSSVQYFCVGGLALDRVSGYSDRLYGRMDDLKISIG